MEQRIKELETELATLKEELEQVNLAKDDVVEKLAQCVEFAQGLKIQRDEAVKTANELLAVMEKKQKKVLLPGNVQPDGTPKLILD